MAGMIETRDVRAAVGRAFAVPFEWGVSDCCRAVSAALVDLGFPDYAARLAYDDEPSARALIARAGGLAPLVGGILCADSWTSAAGEARPGDVGVLVHRGAEALAIHDGVRWCSRSPRGIFSSARRAEAAWRALR